MTPWLRRVLGPLLPVDRFTASDRRVVAVIWAAGLVQGFAQSQVSATLPFTRAGLGLSEGEISLLLGIARIAAFAALPLGWIGDHRGRRRPLLWSVTMVVVGGMLAGLVMEAWQFGAAQAILRTGTAGMGGLAIVLLAEEVAPVIRAYAISFYGAAVRAPDPRPREAPPSRRGPGAPAPSGTGPLPATAFAGARWTAHPLHGPAAGSNPAGPPLLRRST